MTIDAAAQNNVGEQQPDVRAILQQTQSLLSVGVLRRSNSRVSGEKPPQSNAPPASSSTTSTISLPPDEVADDDSS